MQIIGVSPDDSTEQVKGYVLKAANPQPASELEYTNVFELLAAVLLSAQATDAGVNKATRRLFAVANTPARRFISFRHVS